MTGLHRVTFTMPDGTEQSRLIEGTRTRADRETLAPDELAEAIARDRGAVAYTVEPVTRLTVTPAHDPSPAYTALQHHLKGT